MLKTLESVQKLSEHAHYQENQGSLPHVMNISFV